MEVRSTRETWVPALGCLELRSVALRRQYVYNGMTETIITEGHIVMVASMSFQPMNYDHGCSLPFAGSSWTKFTSARK